VTLDITETMINGQEKLQSRPTFCLGFGSFETATRCDFLLNYAG